MIRHPPRSTRPDTLLPCTSLFRSTGVRAALGPGNGMNPPDDGVRAVEAVLFAHEAPLTPDEIRAHVGDGVDVRGALAALEAEYAGRGLEHVRRGGQWIFQAEDGTGRVQGPRLSVRVGAGGTLNIKKKT